MRDFQNKILQVLPDIKNYIYKFIRNIDNVNDIVQNTFFSAYTNITTLKDEGKFKSWLLTIARNECLTYLKETGRYHTLEEIPRYEYLLQDNGIQYQENIITNEKKFSKITQSIYFLSSKLQNVMKYKYFNNLSIKSISEILNLPEGTIKRRLFEARNKLRKEHDMTQNNISIEPQIKIIQKNETTDSTLILNGDGSTLKSILDIGDVELYDRFEYGVQPLPFWHYRTRSVVTKKSNLLGHQVYEVAIEFNKTDEMRNRIYYFKKTKEKIQWVQRIWTTPPFEVEMFDELEYSFDRKVKTGTFENKIVEIVDIVLNDIKYKNCFRELEYCKDDHGNALEETCWSEDGRMLFSRIFIGENWNMIGTNWEKLEKSEQLEWKGEIFRLFEVYVLADHYNLNDEKK